MPLKRIYCRIILFFSVIGICPHAGAQTMDLTFTHINYEQGLSNSSIEAVLQDSRGFLWFGTTDGLNRFDGQSIRVYRHILNDPRSLSNNYIHCLFEDSKHRMWIATNDGLNLFNPVSDDFTNFKHRDDYTKKNGDKINYIFQDDANSLWLCTAWGALTRFDLKSNRFVDLFFDSASHPLEYHNVYCVAKRNAQEFWVGTEKGLNVFNQKLKRFTPDANPYTKEFPYKTRTLAVTADHIVWLGTEENGVFRIDQNSHKIEHFVHNDNIPGSIGNDRVISMLIDRRNRVFFGTVNGGLNIFNENDRTFTKYINNPALKGSLSQRSVSAIYEDNQQNIWVGTPRGGVNMATMSPEKFELYQSDVSGKGLSYNDVRSFCEDLNGNIWVGTDGGGLNYFNKSTKTFKNYRFNIHNKTSLGSDQVMSLCLDHAGRLWIGTFDGGLNLFNPATGTFKRFTHDPNNRNSIASNMVESILEDRQQRLWICTYNGGLNLFDPKTETFKLVGQGLSDDTRLRGIKMQSVKEDREGRLWVVTDDGGLNRFDPRTGLCRHYFDDRNNPELSVICIDHAGRVWAGKKGLYLYDPQKDKFFAFTKHPGLSKEFVKNIIENRPGEFWISTSNGLINYNSVSNRLKAYNTHDGLQGPEFETNSGLKSREGKIYFGGTNGFNAFMPDAIVSNKFIPPVYLTDFQIFNKHIVPGTNAALKEEVSYAKDIELSYLDNSISFDFAALNYVKNENNSFAYKLENFDPDWNYIGHKRHAAYTNLDPGKYVFKVKAANNDDLWNPKETTLHIVITPPFWKTWWFLTLVFIVTALAFFYAYEFKRKTDLKIFMEKQKEVIYSQQLQFFTNISHEFRTPLSLILGPLETLLQSNSALNENRYLQTIEKSAKRLMRLVNELMDFRKLQLDVIKLRIKPHDTLELFEEIAKEFAVIAQQKDIAFAVNFDSPAALLWFDQHIIEKIVYNLLNNAFKYSDKGGQVLFEIYFSENAYKGSFNNQLILKHPVRSSAYFFIKIKDSGIGITAGSIQHLFERYYRTSSGHLGSGIGLAFVKGLTALQRGDIYVSSEFQVGTEFIIALPYRAEDYMPDEIWNKNNFDSHVQIESLVPDQFEIFPSAVVTRGVNDVKPSEQCILLVDDNDELRNFLKDALGNDYLIAQANNGLEGLTLAKEIFPDLIISDVIMPFMDGNEFCTHIKNDVETSHIPFVMLTAKDAVDAKIMGTISGADSYLTKPLNIRLLHATVKNIFDQKQVLKQHYQKDFYSDAKELVHNQLDKEFVEKLIDIIEQRLTSAELGVDYISKEMGMSQSKLYQKIKKISGQSIVEFIRSRRLKKAVQIMTHEDVSINEVIYRVGIQTASYFTKSFKKEFGKTPSQFLNDIKNKS
ncbi:MAG: two-component regulator propeller domain-containing protein [Bacteroidota bacterium]